MSGTFPELQKKKQKIEAKVAQLLAEQMQTDRGQDKPPGQRLAIVEPVFANIRTNKRLDRFTLRGKVKVNIQWQPR